MWEILGQALLCVCMPAPAPLPSATPLQQMSRAHPVSYSTPVNSGWQTAQPAPPLTALFHCFPKVLARAKSVTTFHLLYYNVVQKEVPETPDLQTNSFLNYATTRLLSFFSHNSVKCNMKLWIFYSDWNQQNQKKDSASSAVTAPFCKTEPG